MKRNYKIDILKAFAIILVLVGHSIQYGQGHEFYYNALFFNNGIFRIIYSFHMPLFILISGYLTYYSLNSKNESVIKLILKKIKTLLIPILVWSIIPFALSIRNIEDFNLLFLIKRYILVANDNLWFLWAVLFISIIVIIVNKKFKDNIFVYLIIFLLTFITPDIYNLSLYKYMYPFFMIGYFIYKYNFVNRILKNKVVGIFSILLFVLMIIFFKSNVYVYVSGVSVLHKNILHQLLFDAYRIILAAVGCHIFINISIYLINHMSDKVKNIFIFIGKSTMGIYIISDMIFKYILGEITYNLNYINYFVVILESILILVICLVLVKLISKNKFLNNTLLGGR